jgi:hypothetical protein
MAKKKNQPTTDVAAWDQELADLAKETAGTEASTAGGNFFSLRGGILKFNDAPIPGNKMIVVIVDAILENVHYAEKFDPDTVQSPDCYAFGRKDDDMKPHEQVETPQAKMCNECPHNEWGSAERGRGKECANVRRLALIPGGIMENGAVKIFDDLATNDVAYMKIPVTSVKGYSAFAKNITNALEIPLFAVLTQIEVVPDAKTQFKVVFTALDRVPKTQLPALLQKHKETRKLIDFPYPKFEAPQPEDTGRKGKKKNKY